MRSSGYKFDQTYFRLLLNHVLCMQLSIAAMSPGVLSSLRSYLCREMTLMPKNADDIDEKIMVRDKIMSQDDPKITQTHFSLSLCHA